MEPKRKWYRIKRIWILGGVFALSVLGLSNDSAKQVPVGLNSSANVINSIPVEVVRTISISKIEESIKKDVVQKPMQKIEEKKVIEKCHPSYSGACLKPDASDYDCAGGSGNGPYYTGQVRVVDADVFDLDRDGDGWGCE